MASAFSIGTARAASEVKIGALFPLTGESGSSGVANVAALEVTAAIINGEHPPIPMLLGASSGLDRLGGAKIRIVAADHAGNLQKARAEAERLITQEGVVAIIGSYQSATAAVIGQVTERRGIPFISADNSSPALTRHGLKWFFRTGPHDEMFSESMFNFYHDIGAKTGRTVRSTALFYEDSIFGNDSSAVQRRLSAAASIPVVADIKYRANALSLDAEALRIRDSNADALMPSSYTADAILLLRSLAKIGCKPPVIMSQAAGFQQPAFLDAVGDLANGVFSRSSFALDVGASRPAIQPVNAAIRARLNTDLNDNTSRIVVALQVVADAINRAGTTAPEEIRAALRATSIPGEQTIMPWRGVRFDESGQNVECTPVIQQFIGGSYQTVYPFAVAAKPAIWGVSGPA
ncbi:ABC transporter substrate-binding protein [Acidisphaera sp. L21]|uniref:ABC transporter substrate-binding protein n=1 Tax=Acidisphaera sp. L21 TaxID=1641851 RepID=UPI0020B13FB8|nr:ABC transporter substrate-binding protein [Acidisphaera sp. L21]